MSLASCPKQERGQLIQQQHEHLCTAFRSCNHLHLVRLPCLRKPKCMQIWWLQMCATRAPACPPRGNFPGLPHPAASQTGCTCSAAAEIGCIEQNYFDEGGGGKLFSTESPRWGLLGFCSALSSHHFIVVGRLRGLRGSVSL